VRIGSQIPTCGSLDDLHRSLDCPECLAIYAARQRVSRRRRTVRASLRRGDEPLCNRPWTHDAYHCPDCRIAASSAALLPRCGSTDPSHRARRCAPCKRAAVAACAARKGLVRPSDERARARARRAALRAKEPQPCVVCGWADTAPVSIELPPSAQTRIGRPRIEPGSTISTWACLAHQRAERALFEEHADALRPVPASVEPLPATDPYERLAMGLLADEPAAIHAWLRSHAQQLGGPFGSTLYALVRQWRTLDSSTQQRQRNALTK